MAGTNTPAVRRCPTAATHAARLRRRRRRREGIARRGGSRTGSGGRVNPHGANSPPTSRNHLSRLLFASGGPGHVDTVWYSAHERDRQGGATGQGEAALLTGERTGDRGAQRGAGRVDLHVVVLGAAGAQQECFGVAGCRRCRRCRRCRGSGPSKPCLVRRSRRRAGPRRRRP